MRTERIRPKMFKLGCGATAVLRSPELHSRGFELLVTGPKKEGRFAYLQDSPENYGVMLYFSKRAVKALRRVLEHVEKAMKR